MPSSQRAPAGRVCVISRCARRPCLPAGCKMREPPTRHPASMCRTASGLRPGSTRNTNGSSRRMVKSMPVSLRLHRRPIALSEACACAALVAGSAERLMTHEACALRAANGDSVPSGALVHLVLPVAVWSCSASSDDDSDSDSGCESGSSDSEVQPQGREIPADHQQRVCAHSEALLIAAAHRSRAIPRAQVLCCIHFQASGFRVGGGVRGMK